MLFTDLTAFAADLPAEGALIGLDPGEKRIGLAVCDPARLIASALETIKRVKFSLDAGAIWQAYDGRACVGVVIGWPKNMDGSLGPAAQSARGFAANLLKLRNVPVLLWDERMSTAAVTRTLLEADASRKTRAGAVDKLAAAYMLQGAIDALQEWKARHG